MNEVEKALSNGLNNLRENTDYVKSLTNFPYLNITCYNATRYEVEI
jgi:hypothetical protein